MKRTPLRRKTPLRSRSPLVSSGRISRKEPIARRSRVRTRNTKRHATNWQRAYCSAARVQWVKQQPCALTGDTGFPLRVNAHTVTGGKGRKADYTTIIPLRADLHDRQHRKGWRNLFMNREPISNEDIATMLAGWAAETQVKWEREAARLGIDP